MAGIYNLWLRKVILRARNNITQGVTSKNKLIFCLTPVPFHLCPLGQKNSGPPHKSMYYCRKISSLYSNQIKANGDSEYLLCSTLVTWRKTFFSISLPRLKLTFFFILFTNHEWKPCSREECTFSSCLISTLEADQYCCWWSSVNVWLWDGYMVRNNPTFE